MTDWTRLSVGVAGIGVAGYACADALMQKGARVTIVDSGDGERQRERAEILRELGATVHLGHQGGVPAPIDVLVVSPGVRPTDPVILDAQAHGAAVWGEIELAWRMRGPKAADWLCITGTNGKTTTTLMLESMLRAAGLAAAAAGNIGAPLVDAVLHDPLDVIAVEIGAPQLPFVDSMSPWSAVCLNVAEDHVDHFGSMAEYVSAKARVFRGTQVAAVYNVQDPQTEHMVQEADVVEGCRAIGFTLGVPAPSMLGVVDDMLVDRAFVENRHREAQELCAVADVQPAAPHNVANALAAAALARSYGVAPTAVREGLRGFTPAAHRIAEVGTVDAVRYIDDSKATNAHAALTSLLAYDHIVWIAGGLAKGQQFDELVQAARDRLRAVVLLGQDREVLAQALARHAPDVPVTEVMRGDHGAMEEVVARAAQWAQAGDTVLLAPGCASWDMFRDYADRGEQFAAAVRRLPGQRGGSHA